MPVLTAQERLGTRIGGRYRIDRVLASGGMSVLFAARDLRAQRTVALKLLRAEDCIEERRKARFLQEMRLTAKLRHPNVVDVLDLGEDDNGAPYLVMELLHGRSLQAELDERGTLGFEQTLAIMLPVMEALDAVHAAGVVHRDVKPDNIFLHVDPRGTQVPKLLDFGIAKAADTTLATRTGAVLGTPDYMAPEQVLAGSVGPSADVWAIGAVFYRALCGRTPHHAATSAEVIAKLTRDPAPPLRTPELAVPICAAIDRALAREPDDRYPDIAAFAHALVLCAQEAGLACVHAPAFVHRSSEPAVAHQRTLTTPSANIEPRSRGMQRAWGAGLAGVVLIGIAALQWMAREPPRASQPRAGVAVLESDALEASRAVAQPVANIAPVAATTTPAREEAVVATAEVVPVAPQAAATNAQPQAPEVTPARRAHSAASRRSRATATPHSPASAAGATFSKPNAGDLPVAVVW